VDPLPPGPAAGVLAQTVLLHRDPLGTLRALQHRFGDVFTMRLATARPIVVVAAPTAIEELVASDPGAAHAGEARRLLFPIASARSVFGGDGDVHRAARRRVAGALSREALERQHGSMVRLAEKHAEGWPRLRPLRLLPRIRALIDDVFVRLVLGVGDEARAQAAAIALRRMLWTPGNPPFTLPGEGDGLAGRVGSAVFERRKAPLAAVLAEEIETRRRAGDLGEDLIGDVLRDEPDLPAGAIVDELLVVLMAAQEPASIALARLLCAPSADGEAAVRETLRLWPPAIGALRRLTAPREVAGHPLPAGVTVMVPIPLVQRDPRSFPDPDVFRPDRWTSGEADERAYLPFGGGARRCVGEPLAHLYFDTVLPSIRRRVGIRPLVPGGERGVMRATQLVPQRGGLVRVSSR
jgi:cytochrome P450 family 135